MLQQQQQRVNAIRNETKIDLSLAGKFSRLNCLAARKC